MDNPGVYAEHLQPDAWPFVPFLGAVAFVPIFLLGVLMIHGGISKVAKFRGAVVVAISIGLLSVSIVGLTAVNDSYYEEEASNQELYRQEVHAWALTTYGLDLTDSELSSLLNQETVLLDSAEPPQRAHLLLDRVNDKITIVNDLNQAIAAQ